MDNRFKKCLDESKLVKSAPEPDLMRKEIDGATSDLESAGISLEKGDYKWATVQAYYSMFHSAKALVLSKGYREKSHMCLLVAFGELFADSLPAKHYERFRDCMNLRHDADYGLIYSEGSAREVVAWAGEFLEEAGKMLGI